MGTPVATLDTPALAAQAGRLRALHRPGDPLVLVNAWDVASAQAVAAAGARAVATSSAAVAAALGLPDDDSMPPTTALGAVRRIAAAVAVPVTADVEAGYGLSAEALVEGLLGAGAVGCNLEDSDHARPGALVAAEAFAARLAGVRDAARASGVDLVLNARIDAFLHASGAPADALDDAVRRGRLYAEAGADCVYPIGLRDPGVVARFVAAVGAPVNLNAHPGASVKDLAAAGASRISVGPMAQRWALAEVTRRAELLLCGGTPQFSAPA